MLISSTKALDSLSVSVPRLLAKKLLCWAVFAEGARLYFLSGTIREECHWRLLLSHVRLNPFERKLAPKAPLIRGRSNFYQNDDRTDEDIFHIMSYFGVEVARAVKYAHGDQQIELRKDCWVDEPREFPIEIILRSSEIDWDGGILKATLHHDSTLGDRCELLRAATLDSKVIVILGGMSFESNDIQALLQPKFGVHKGTGGRSREHDWEGALLYLLGQAEKHSIAGDPYARGAQARIVRLLADWFFAQEGATPADSQLQVFANKVLSAIKNTM